MKPTLPLRRWTPDEDARLRAWYGTHSARAIAAQLGRTRSAVKMRVVFLGLIKKHNSGTFVPGQTPWNKGMKGLDIGGKATRFKPGHRAGRAAQLADSGSRAAMRLATDDNERLAICKGPDFVWRLP